MKSARCFCRHVVVLASNFASLLFCSPKTVLLFWWSGDFQAPSDAREHFFHPVSFWLQRLSWVNIVRHVLQVCDLMKSSVSLFSVDILQYEAPTLSQLLQYLESYARCLLQDLSLASLYRFVALRFSFLCWVFCVSFLARRPVCGLCSPVFFFS